MYPSSSWVLSTILVMGSVNNCNPFRRIPLRVSGHKPDIQRHDGEFNLFLNSFASLSNSCNLYDLHSISKLECLLHVLSILCGLFLGLPGIPYLSVRKKHLGLINTY